jgi:hypothetical protein
VTTQPTSAGTVAYESPGSGDPVVLLPGVDHGRRDYRDYDYRDYDYKERQR